MKKLLVLVSIVGLVVMWYTVSVTEAGTFVYTASTGFSGPPQGTNGWSYYYQPLSGGSPIEMAWAPSNPDAGGQNTWKGPEQYLLIYNNRAIPGNNADAIRRWTAPYSGTARIQNSGGNLRDMNPTCGTDNGAVVSIKKNGSNLPPFPKTIANGDTIGIPFDIQNVSITKGDTIDFVVNKGTVNNYCDELFFDAKITLTTPNISPTGVLDGIQSDGHAYGWAYDPDVASTSIKGRVSIDGTFIEDKTTTVFRSDVNSAYGITGKHGFDFFIPTQYKDGVSHTLRVQAIDTSDSTIKPDLTLSPKTFTIVPPSSPCDTAYKANIFHVCFFNGKTAPLSGGTILGQIDEASVPSPAGSWSGFDRNWSTGVVGGTTKSDQVSGVWRGKVNFQAGDYMFHTISDDGVELEIEGFGKIINNWTDHGDTQNNSAQIAIPAGARNATLRWYDNTGGARIRLWWDYVAPVPTGTLTVAKTFLDVVKDHPSSEVRLDGGAFTAAAPAIFPNVSAGSHTVTFEVPSGMKAFYAICANDTTCLGPLQGGTVGPTTITGSFSHTTGQNDFMRIFYGPTTMEYTQESVFGNTISKKEAGNSFTAIFSRVLDVFRRVFSKIVQANYKVRGNKIIVDSVGDNESLSTCSRVIYVADTPGDDGITDGPGDLYALARDAVEEWNARIKLNLSFGGTLYPSAVPPQTINGKSTYPRIADGKSIISYGNPTSQFDIFEGAFIPALAMHDVLETKSVDGKYYLLETDMQLNPELCFYTDPADPAATQGPCYYIPAIMRHELGHFIGLDDFELDLAFENYHHSIMMYRRGGAKEDNIITGNDIFAINKIYKDTLGCKLPTKASLVLTLLSEGQVTVHPAPLCRNRSDLSWLAINGKITEVGGGVGVNLESVKAQYISVLGASSGASVDVTLGGWTFPFSDLVGDKGFPSNRVPAGGSISAQLCQPPWSPERLQNLDLFILGTDDGGQKVEAFDDHFLPF